jgi:hypothetical protein
MPLPYRSQKCCWFSRKVLRLRGWYTLSDLGITHDTIIVKVVYLFLFAYPVLVRRRF